ncbi:MAG TPA: ammonium transporter [Limnochordia bacterium]|nr:ammonium transporter [Limnochordia bacterium]
MQPIDVFFFLWAASLIFFMKAGFIALEVGQFGARSVGYHSSLKMVDLAAAILAYTAVGYAIAYGRSGYDNPADTAWMLKMCMFAVASVTIVTGTVAERIKLVPYAVASLLLAGVAYPIVEHWAWGGGWLANLGYHDFAGSGVVHTFGGVVGLVAAFVLGPRRDRFGADGKARPMPGHNPLFSVMGAFILAFGWYGFNIGSAASADPTILVHAALTTTLALAGGIMGGLLVSGGDPLYAANGMCAGLVAVCAGADVLTPWGAALVGAVCGWQLPFTTKWVEKLRIDDVCAVTPVHAVSGLIGVVAAGLPFLVEPASGTAWLAQVAGAAAITVFAGAVGFVLYKGLQLTLGLRVPEAHEALGMDRARNLAGYADRLELDEGLATVRANS